MFAERLIDGVGKLVAIVLCWSAVVERVRHIVLILHVLTEATRFPLDFRSVHDVDVGAERLVVADIIIAVDFDFQLDFADQIFVVVVQVSCLPGTRMIANHLEATSQISKLDLWLDRTHTRKQVIGELRHMHFRHCTWQSRQRLANFLVLS